MNAPVPIRHTQAETDLLSRFEASKADLHGSDDVQARRAAALELLRSNGLPHRRVEEYKYTDLRVFWKSAVALSGPLSVDAARNLLEKVTDFATVERYRLVLVNGRFMPELGDSIALAEKGIQVTDLNDVLSSGQGADILSVPQNAETDGVLALNTAFLQGGLVVRVDAGVDLDKPLEILHLGSGEGAQVTRCRIELGKDAKLRVFERFGGITGEGEINAVFDYDLADGSALSSTRLMTETMSKPLLVSCMSRLGANARLNTMGLIAGPALARNQQFVAFAGEHSEARIYGVSLARNRDLADQTLVVDHVVPNCNSREFFKNVLDDEARGVYQGRINVAQHAQKTDGEMMTQALLLCEGPEMANKPELEIFADDVICAHGATCGEIDEDLLFYLRARGIPEAQARLLLVLAFVSEAIEEYGEEDVREALEERVRDWLMVA